MECTANNLWFNKFKSGGLERERETSVKGRRLVLLVFSIQMKVLENGGELEEPGISCSKTVLCNEHGVLFTTTELEGISEWKK